MKKILEYSKTIRNIALTVTAVGAVVLIGWKTDAYFDTTYVQDDDYTKQCAAWKAELDILKEADAELEEAIAGVSRQQMINSIRQNLAYYKQMIDEYHRKYGVNCAQCNSFDRQQYNFYRREYDKLLGELRRLGG